MAARRFVCPKCGNSVETAIRGDYPTTAVYCYGKDMKPKYKHRKRVMKEKT